MGQWTVKRVALSAPSLEELAPVIASGLEANFKHVSISVGPCADLRAFGLAARGLSGNARIADVGGPPNLTPLPKLDRKYSLLEMKELMEMQDSGFLLGASAGPFHVVGMNSELMPNLSYSGATVTNATHLAKINDDGVPVCEKSSSVEFGLMGNLFGCDGSEGPVLRINARTRTGKLNFTAAIQGALKREYGERTISMGGVFVIKAGKANLHVMPDFSPTPLATNEAVSQWLRYFDMSAPLVCLSVFHSHDPGLDLRMEHTHCFSDHGQGGHYHDDITPDEVEYEAYFNVAQVLYRIDQPGDDAVRRL